MFFLLLPRCSKLVTMKKETKKKMGEWLMDVAKYMLTAVLISSIFKDIDNKWAVYSVCIVGVFLSFYLGANMFDRNTKQQ